MAMLKSWSLFLAAITALSLLSVFISFSDIYKDLVGNNKWLQFLILFIIFIVVYVLLFIIWYFILYFYKKFKIKNSKTRITIYKKNIFHKSFFDSKKVILIPVDKDFTTNFNENGKIDENTTHGQFLKKFGNNITEIQTKENGFLKQFKFQKDEKELVVFFMPLTKIKSPNYKAEIKSIDEFLIDCKNTIDYVNGNLNGRELIMPIIGSGKSRIYEKSLFFDDINNILSLWIMYFQIFGYKDLKVGISVLPNQWQLINFHKY